MQAASSSASSSTLGKRAVSVVRGVAMAFCPFSCFHLTGARGGTVGNQLSCGIPNFVWLFLICRGGRCMQSETTETVRKKRAVSGPSASSTEQVRATADTYLQEVATIALTCPAFHWTTWGAQSTEIHTRPR